MGRRMSDAHKSPIFLGSRIADVLEVIALAHGRKFMKATHNSRGYLRESIEQ